MKIDIKELLDEELNDNTDYQINERFIIKPSLVKIIKAPKEFDYDEEYLAEDYSIDFSYPIRQRGEEYYNSNNVINVYKNNNKYIAKVIGSSDEIYNVIIEVNEDGLNYNCTCPCTYPCKHEYATLLAISNKDYLEVNLKEFIMKNEVDIKSILSSIPAEELKKYILLLANLNKLPFEKNLFEEYFKKYYPHQSYEYYYNNLYNGLSLDDFYEELVESYLSEIKQYIAGSEFSETVKIIKAIVNAYSDTDRLDYDDFIDLLPRIGMFLRVAYRKSSNNVKNEINNWLQELENVNYYNNYYLEDMVLSVIRK